MLKTIGDQTQELRDEYRLLKVHKHCADNNLLYNEFLLVI